MKKILLLVSSILFVLSGCESDASLQTIIMNEANGYYETEDWSLESVVSEFEKMGFSNIETVALHNAPEYVYDSIETVSINDGWTGWNAGDKYLSSDKVEIRYYRSTPTLTSESCPELEAVLRGEKENWIEFAETHDRQFIEFEGFVQDREDPIYIDEPILQVSAGEYLEENLKHPKIKLIMASSSEAIGYQDEIDHHIDDCNVGDTLKVVGRIEANSSKQEDRLTLYTYVVKRINSAPPIEETTNHDTVDVPVSEKTPELVVQEEQGYTIIEVPPCNLSGSRMANVKVDVGYGDREYWAYTNEFGQLVRVEAREIILQDDTIENVNADGRYCSDEAKVPGTEDPNLDEGHVIADSLGGVSNAYNITPQNSTLNRHGDQAYMEKVIRQAGGCTDFQAIITYPDTTTQIPNHYKYTYTINGQIITDEFDNVNPDDVNKDLINNGSYSNNTSNVEPVVSNAIPVESNVWIPATGSKYHSKPDCGNMKPNTATQTTKSEAEAKGYEPCKRCH